MKAKPVVAVDRRDGVILEHFNSASEAERFYGMSHGACRRNCQNKAFLRGSYVALRWADDYDVSQEVKKERGSAPLPVVCEQRGEQYAFPDIKTAAYFLGVSYDTLRQALYRGKPTRDGVAIKKMETLF